MWFTEQGSDKIGKWDPATNEVTEYQDPQIPGKEGTLPGGSKHTLRVEPNGDVWSTGGPVSKFDPKTKQFTDIKEIPSAYGIALAQDGTVWFAEFTPDGKIGKIDPKTLKVTKYTVPTPNARPRRIQVDTRWHDLVLRIRRRKAGPLRSQNRNIQGISNCRARADAVRHESRSRP